MNFRLDFLKSGIVFPALLRIEVTSSSEMNDNSIVKVTTDADDILEFLFNEKHVLEIVKSCKLDHLSCRA